MRSLRELNAHATNSASAPGADVVRGLILKKSQDLVCVNIMCEKVLLS